MKTRAMLMAAVMATTMMVCSRVANAQQSLIVNIPFDFAAGKATLPAGEYSVEVSGPTKMLRLINRDNAAETAFVAAIPAESAQVQTQSKLIFNRHGDHYFLTQVWTEGNSSGAQLSKSAREKEMAMVAKNETRDQVTLVASLSPAIR